MLDPGRRDLISDNLSAFAHYSGGGVIFGLSLIGAVTPASVTKIVT